MALDQVAAALSKLRNREVRGNIAAVLAGESSLRGRDGRCWTFCVTDGKQVAWIAAELSRHNGGVASRLIEPVLLEAAMERRAINGFPIETRMRDLVSAAPIALRPEDLKLHPNLGIFL